MPNRVEHYLAVPYPMEIYWDEDYWAARAVDLGTSRASCI